MQYSTTQTAFFQKIDIEKYSAYKNNVCGIASVFLIVKELGIEISEEEVFDRAMKLNAYDEKLGWKYEGLIQVLRYFTLKTEIAPESFYIFDTKIFHKRRLQKLLLNLGTKKYIASIRLDDNHLIIIDKVEYNNVYYTSVGTRGFEPVMNKIIKMQDFFDVYNGRGVVIDV